jgi:hypothetical protein
MTTNDDANDLIPCEICLKAIARSTAYREIAADNVHYFCGSACREKWRTGPTVLREFRLELPEGDPGFTLAERLAQAIARQLADEAMLIAWFDRAQGKESPEIPECQNKPGWIAYAKVHGGDMKVDINQGAYLFIFASGTSH